MGKQEGIKNRERGCKKDDNSMAQDSHVFTKKLIFLLLHNHMLDIFLIHKGHMGNKLSLSLLLVSLVLLSHLFYHILLFLKRLS
jgi:hypothetical protein